MPQVRRGRWLLDRPVKPGDDKEGKCWAQQSGEVFSDGKGGEPGLPGSRGLMCLLERGDQILDRDTLAVIGVDEAGLDLAVGADDEGGRDR